MERNRRLRRRVRVWLGVFLAGLVASGLTAFPLGDELEWLGRAAGLPAVANPADYTGVQAWIATVRNGLRAIHQQYPWAAYGTDWLAFAHLVIALFFIGPLLRPAGDRWVIVAGMIACGLVPVLALTCGPLRGIPLWWRLIDCSFGALGIVPLGICYQAMRKLGARLGTEQTARSTEGMNS